MKVTLHRGPVGELYLHQAQTRQRVIIHISDGFLQISPAGDIGTCDIASSAKCPRWLDGCNPAKCRGECNKSEASRQFLFTSAPGDSGTSGVLPADTGDSS